VIVSRLRKFILAGFAVLSLLSSVGAALAQPAPVPALPDTERRTSYSITASQCNCGVGFALFGDSNDFQNWVEVFVNGAMLPASGNWTITSPSGPLANLARPITDAVLTFTNAQTGIVQIVGARRPRRVSQFSENQGVSARNLNQVITDIIAQNREIWDKTNDVSGRALLARPGETLALLPVLASRQNMGACFDSGGNLTSCVSIPTGAFAAGSGITFTGTGPTTISTSTYSAGAGVTFSGSNPTVVSATGTIGGSNGPFTLAPELSLSSGVIGLTNPPRGASVNLNNTSQTWIPPNPNKYHLFAATTVKYNQGNLYAVVTGGAAAAFVPPNGAHLIALTAQVWITSGALAAPANWVAKWIKNSTVDGSLNIITGTDVCAGIGAVSDAGPGSATIRAECFDAPSPGDYYNLFMFVDSTTLGTTVITADGNPAHTYAQATVIY
jgi:hypothetical protein